MNVSNDGFGMLNYFSQHPIFDGEYILRPFQTDDVKGLFELDSIPEVHRYLGTKPMQKIEEAQRVLDGLLEQYKNNGIGRLAIEERRTQKFVGWSGLKYETVLRKENPYFDLGYRLKPAFWKQGIGSASAQLSVKLGFEVLKLEKLGAVTMPGNIGSNRIIRSLGFQQGQNFVFEGEELFWYELKREDYLNQNNV